MPRHFAAALPVVAQFQHGQQRFDFVAVRGQQLALMALDARLPITGKKAGFRSLGDTWADTTTDHGRLMLAVL